MITAERLKELKEYAKECVFERKDPIVSADALMMIVEQLERAQVVVDALEILAKPCAQSEYATANCDCMCVRDCGNTAREALNVWRGETNG